MQQQASLTHTAGMLKQDAQTVQRVQHANTKRLQYDAAAVDRVSGRNGIRMALVGELSTAAQYHI